MVPHRTAAGAAGPTWKYFVTLVIHRQYSSPPGQPRQGPYPHYRPADSPSDTGSGPVRGPPPPIWTPDQRTATAMASLQSTGVTTLDPRRNRSYNVFCTSLKKLRLLCGNHVLILGGSYKMWTYPEAYLIQMIEDLRATVAVWQNNRKKWPLGTNVQPLGAFFARQLAGAAREWAQSR